MQGTVQLTPQEFMLIVYLLFALLKQKRS